MTDTAKVALVTGATSGLGRAVAIALATDHRMQVLIHGRDQRRADAVVHEIERMGGSARTYLADLGTLDQVGALADRVAADHPALHLLINNAGIGAGRPPYRKRELSADGHELRLAVNYLAAPLLTRRLLPTLTRDTPARIVNIASVGQSPVDFADPGFEHHYSSIEAYNRSKFALVAFTFDLAEELAGHEVTVNCLHPASLMNTRMVRQALVPPLSTVQSGVQAVMNLAAGPVGGTVSGRYFDGIREARAHAGTYDPAVRARLRALTADLLAR